MADPIITVDSTITAKITIQEEIINVTIPESINVEVSNTIGSQVPADWNSVTGNSFIQNKPTIPTALSQLSDDSTHRLVTDDEKTTWNSSTGGGITLQQSIAMAIALG